MHCMKAMHILFLFITITIIGSAADTATREHSRQVTQFQPDVQRLHYASPWKLRQRILLPFPHWSFLANVEIAKAMTIWVPVAAACAAFVDFYLNVLDLLIEVWSMQPEQNQVVIQAGNLRLEFGCSQEPVPWGFVHDFFHHKLDAVNRGFAEDFSKEWWHEKDDQHRLCYVGFRVLDPSSSPGLGVEGVPRS